MGCCTSVSKSGRPIKASIVNTSQAELLEEEKNPDLYRQGSALQGSQILQESTAPPPMKLLDPSPPKIPSRAPSRQPSEFNLHKDLIESMRHERTKSMSMALENGGQIDESIYKLTKDQHKMIYDFVEERTKMMKEDIMKLNAHLCTHDNEVEELALIVEDLRTSEKDIANCVEDLRSFSVRNEEEYYKSLEKDCQFAKDLITEYRTYQNGLCNFQTMKSETIKILRARNIKPYEKPIEADPPAEKSVIEPMFEPPVESTQETKEEIKPEKKEAPQPFQITTVFEEVEGQPIEPKPTNNDLEPLQEEHQKDKTEIKEPQEISPLPFTVTPRKSALERTLDEADSSGLKSCSNYLVHHGAELSKGSQESPQAKPESQAVQAQEIDSPPRKYMDLSEAMAKSENVKTESPQKSNRKPPLDEKIKRVRKVRAPTKRQEKNDGEFDVMDSRSDLESIGVDVRDSERDLDNISVQSFRSRKAMEVYNIDFSPENLQSQVTKQTPKKINRMQIKEKPKGKERIQL